MLRDFVMRESILKDLVVVGANGFIGRHLISSAAPSLGMRLRVLAHRGSPDGLLNKENITVIKGDLLFPETLDTLCGKDATVVNAAYLRQGAPADNLAAVSNLLDACVKARIRRFIHCSTASVFGRVSGDVIDERAACNPVTEYETTKMRIEEIVRERSAGAFESVILRPTAIFGPGGKNLLKLAHDLRSGRRMSNYLKSCLFFRRTMNLVSVHNVAAAIELFIRAEKIADGEVYIVSDDDSAANNYSYVEERLMKGLGLPAYPLPVVPVPGCFSSFLLRMAGRTNDNPRRVYSCQKLREAGFRKAVSFEDALVDFTDWYKTHESA